MKLLTILGARPQFVKASALSRCLLRHPRPSIRDVIVHTGQHFDANMSQTFFDELGIPAPHYNLGIQGGTHGQRTGRMLEALEPILEKEAPDWVIVYGDTDSTLAGALAAAKLHLPIAHIEAGARSFNRRMPEETNRVVTDHVSSALMCPTFGAVENLRREGFQAIARLGELVDMDHGLREVRLSATEPTVVNVGDVMFDVILYFRDRALKVDDNAAREQSLRVTGSYVLATVHRAENTGDPMVLESILKRLIEVGKDFPVVFPVHPRTRKMLMEFSRLRSLISATCLDLREPMSYLEFIHMQANARAIVTDSGGVQKEAFFLGIPCFTLRDETEWPETIAHGANVLVGRNPRELNSLISQVKQAQPQQSYPYGKGKAAETILELLAQTVRR